MTASERLVEIVKAVRVERSEVERLRALLSEALDRLVASAPSYIDPGFRDLVARIEAVVNEEKA